MGTGQPPRAHQSIDQLTETSLTYLNMAIAPSTNQNYSAALRTYESFCHHHKQPPFPPLEQTLVLFATHIASYSSHSNIKIHMAAIKHFAIIKGCTPQFERFHRLYLLIRGIKRSQGTSRSIPKRHPITPLLLHTINKNLFSSSRLYEDKVMLWTAILVAFFGFLRVSEYTSTHKTKYDPSTTLLLSDVHLLGNAANIMIKASKTDPFRQGVTIRLAQNNTHLCPLNALRTFIPIHPTKQGPLFTFHNKKLLTPKDLNQLLLDTTNGMVNISSHSLRIGAASTAAAMGCPKWLIQNMGRWASDCFRSYIRISDATIAEASRTLAQCNISIPHTFEPHEQ